MTTKKIVAKKVAVKTAVKSTVKTAEKKTPVFIERLNEAVSLGQTGAIALRRIVMAATADEMEDAVYHGSDDDWKMIEELLHNAGVNLSEREIDKETAAHNPS